MFFFLFHQLGTHLVVSIYIYKSSRHSIMSLREKNPFFWPLTIRWPPSWVIGELFYFIFLMIRWQPNYTFYTQLDGHPIVSFLRDFVFYNGVAT